MSTRRSRRGRCRQRRAVLGPSSADVARPDLPLRAGAGLLAVSAAHGNGLVATRPRVQKCTRLQCTAHSFRLASLKSDAHCDRPRNKTHPPSDEQALQKQQSGNLSSQTTQLNRSSCTTVRLESSSRVLWQHCCVETTVQGRERAAESTIPAGLLHLASNTRSKQIENISM